MYPQTCFVEMVSVSVCHLRIEHLKCLPLPVYDQTVICASFLCVITFVAYPICSDLLIPILYFEAHKLRNSWCNCSYPRVISLDDIHVRTHADGQTHVRDSFCFFIELSYIVLYRHSFPGVKQTVRESDYSPHEVQRLRMSRAVPQLPQLYRHFCPNYSL